MLVSGMPTSAAWWPPATRIRPSGRTMWPEQNVFTAYGTGVNAPVVGFQTRCEFGPAAKPSQTRTLPVGSSTPWTVTSGQLTGDDHWPTTAGSGGGGGGDPDGVTSIAAASGSSAEPYTDWMFRNPSETWTPVIVLTYAVFAPPAAAQMSRLEMSGLVAVSTMSIE